MKGVIAGALLIAVAGCSRGLVDRAGTGTAGATGQAGTGGTTIVTGQAGTGGTGVTGGTGTGGTIVSGRGGTQQFGGPGQGGAGAHDAGQPATILCCVAALIAPCAQGGACVQSTVDGGPANRVCFASGVKVVTTYPERQGCSASNFCSTVLEEVYKPDGSLCYSVESAYICEQACVFQSEKWYDGAGRLVAQGPAGSVACVSDADASPGIDSGVVCEYAPPGYSCTVGTCQ